MDANEFKRRFPNASPGCIARNAGLGVAGPPVHISPDSVLSPAQPQQHAEDAGRGPGPRTALLSGRRLVRVTSFRIRLCDERNLFDKHLVDCLVQSGLLHDDSPQWAQIIVTQVQVNVPALQRTEIVIEPL